MRNYYSPQPNVPLVLFLTANQAQVARKMNYKVVDYDGHQMQVLPVRVQNNRLAHITYTSTTPMTLFADKPLAGPEMQFVEFTKTSQMMESPPSGFGLITEKATVIEVQDFLWKQLESPVPRSFKDCILDNQFKDPSDVAYTDARLSSLPREQWAAIARDKLCGAQQTLAPTVERCRALSDTTLLDLCPQLEYDIYQTAPKVSYAARFEYPTATAGGTVVQSMTTPLVQNCPIDRTPIWHSDVQTEINCYPGESCFAALVAQVGRAASKIEFEEAPGSADMGECLVFNQDTCLVDYTSAPCGCCSSRSRCNEDGSCGAEILSEHRCRHFVRTPTIEDVGLSHVMCFIAKAAFCKSVGRESEEECPVGQDYCYSTPLCVRFNYVGHAPEFVAPTPLAENALDSSGQVMKGFTDIGACEGYSVPFALKAHDVDTGDQVRIVLDDTERGTSFFFSQFDFSSTQSESCGIFQAYGAKRSGNNSQQHSFLHLRNAEFDDSIVAPLNDDIQWVTSTARQRIAYTLNASLNNGIFIREDCTNPVNPTNMCRQRLLNADRVICGYALDNSRARYRRWMGGRTDSHNFGSYSSPRHCWRIRLQAPPTFVTNSTGCVAYNGLVVSSSCTPFNPAAHTIRDPTDQPVAWNHIRMGYTSRLDINFVAYDPNPQDRVTMFVKEEPGIPENMEVGRVECLTRAAKRPDTPQALEIELENGKCPQKCASDETDSGGKERCECAYSTEYTSEQKLCPADLSCNRARMRLQWQPQVQDAGKTFKVCVMARDDSDLCHGVSPTATAAGWYGETQCVQIEVIRADLAWSGPWIEDYFLRPTPHPVYVGCSLSFDIKVSETTAGATYGLKVHRSETAGELAAQDLKMHVTLTDGVAGVTTVTATPRLGSEGATLYMCFMGGYQYRGITYEGMCNSTADLYKGCVTDADCASSKCIPVCVPVEVQKCRYCVADGDPLRTLMKDFFIDTNWLRLWSLNNDLHATLGTECLPGLDCDQNVENLMAIGNPLLTLGTPSGRGKRILWAGILHKPIVEEDFESLACLHRTSLKSLVAVNPDLDVLAPGSSAKPGEAVCIVSCSSENMDPQCAKHWLAQ